MFQFFWNDPHEEHHGGHGDWRKAMKHGMRGFGRGFGRHWGDFDWAGEGRARRGDVKYLILELLAERPRHGYEIMTDLEARYGYRPSPGSVYPTLQMLEDGSFVTSDQRDGKRVYTITDEGRRMLAERQTHEQQHDEFAQAFHEVAREAKEAVVQLGMAVAQAAKLRDPDVWKRVIAVIDNARREIYQILAQK